MVELEGHSFPIDVVHEKLPDKRNRCRHLRKETEAANSQPSLAGGQVNNKKLRVAGSAKPENK